MRTDYECPKCERVAYKGGIGWENKRQSQMRFVIKPVLELECIEKDHPNWQSFVRCQKCNKVPNYFYKIHKKGAGLIPYLECCGESWSSPEYGINPFGREIAI